MEREMQRCVAYAASGVDDGPAAAAAAGGARTAPELGESERNARKMTVFQEPMVFNMLSLDYYNLGKSELNSSFLALLSGRLHHSSSETPLSYSASEIAKVQVRDAGSSVMCDEPTTCIPTSTENHGSDDIRTAARPLPVFTCTNEPSDVVDCSSSF